MPVKVHIRNFQSLRDVRLTIDGLTALTGSNNVGKSAVMRALRGVFQNPPATSHVRHGAEELQVDLEFEDGSKLTWKKGKKPCYVINGGKPIFPGRAVPDEVRAFGVAPVNVGGQDVWPNIAPQFTGQVFLLDQPGSALAEAVADVERVSLLNNALRASESDKRSAQASLKVRLEDEAKHTKRLAAFDGLDEALSKVDELKEVREALSSRGRGLAVLEALATKRKAALADVAALAKVPDILIPNAEKATALSRAATNLQSVGTLAADLRTARLVVRTLRGVREISIPASGDAESASREMGTLAKTQSALVGARSVLARLAGVPNVQIPVVVVAQEAFSTLLGLDNLRAALGTAVSVLAAAQKQMLVANLESVEAESQVHTHLQGFAECPYCGSGLEAHP